MDQHTIQEGKTMAVISYITLIGLLIAYLVNNDRRNAFTSFHIGQSVRVVLLGLANYVLSFLLPAFLGFIITLISIGILVLVILGIVNAVNGKAVPLPVIGQLG